MIGIRVVSRAGAAPSPPLAATFDAQIGDIGRSPDCSLVLPDPERRISRRQALITYRAGRHFIRPIGTNLAVELNGTPLVPENEYPLEDGAEIRIGPYVLRVEEQETGLVAPAPSAAAAASAPTDEDAKAAEDPLALFGRAGARPNVFGDLLADAASPPVPERVAKAATLPQRHEPPAAAPIVAPPLPAPGARVDLPGGEPTGAARKAPRRTRATGGEQAAARTQSGAVDELVAALYAGLGIAPPGAMASSPQQMRLIGALLRAAIAGTLQLLAARTIAKRELGAEGTRLQSRENNPLKFSPDVDAALLRLLGPPERGFVAPLPAVGDAFGDLRAHQVAVLAGMRAALDAVLERFDPEVLAVRLAPKGMLDNLVPATRKAKLWEQYSERYAEILREVEDDFDTLFGNAFLQAYKAQLAELARAPDAAAPGQSERG